MKKIILLSIFTLLPIFLPAAYVNGPLINYKGKPSSSGHELSKWFNSYLGNSWQVAYFTESNKEFFEWEIEKEIKINLFKMDFFSRTYLDINQAVKYLILHPKAAKKLIYLAGLYHEFGDKPYNFYDSEGLEYLLIKYDPSWKDNTQHRFHRGKVDRIIKKYDERYPKKKQVVPKELKQKAYDNYISFFKKSQHSFGWNDLIKNWDVEHIVRDILKRKVITNKNYLAFISLLRYLNKIPDDIAEKVIEHFKLNTASPQISISFLTIIGKNPKLTKAILKNFNLLKKPSYEKKYYIAASLILKKNVNNVSPSAWVKYASITGDYNGVFQKMSEAGKRAAQNALAEKKRRWDNFIRQDKAFIKRFENSKTPEGKKLFAAVQKSLKNPGWYPPSISIDNNYLKDGAGLINKGSKLSKQNARLVLNNISTTIEISQRRMPVPVYEPEPKFGKLLPEKLLKFTNTVSLPFGSCYPFESLSSSGRKTLFATYSDIIKRKKSVFQKKAVIKRLLSIKSPKYRKKTIKLLMEIKSRRADEALQAISLEWLPELLKIAGGKDPELGVKACQLIGITSVFGKSVVPKLKNLLKTTKDFTIKTASICALAEIGDKSSIPLIKQYCNDKNRLLARAAKQAVYLLQPIDKNDPYFKEILRKKAKRKVWR